MLAVDECTLRTALSIFVWYLPLVCLSTNPPAFSAHLFTWSGWLRAYRLAASAAPASMVSLRRSRMTILLIDSDRITTASCPGYHAPPTLNRPGLPVASPASIVGMTGHEDVPRVVRASREIAASAGRIFELIADPAQQPRWDGNDNLEQAPGGQRVRAVGDMFTMTLTGDHKVRENHVVEFEEGRLIAWRPAEPGKQPPGHLWRWTLDPIDPSRTRVTHTYDWTQLTDENRLKRARETTADNLQASLDRLAALAERE
jgi:uncharacterized protein YndB with AHSA1/START domain